jgi:hypothetical protein
LHATPQLAMSGDHSLPFHSLREYKRVAVFRVFGDCLTVVLGGLAVSCRPPQMLI